MKKILIQLALLLCGALTAHGQMHASKTLLDQQETKVGYNTITGTPSLQLDIEVPSNYAQLHHQLEQGKAYFKVDLGDVYALGDLDFKVILNARYRVLHDAEELLSNALQMELDPRVTERLFVQDFTALYQEDDANKLVVDQIQVELKNQQDNALTGTLKTLVEERLRIELASRISLGVDVRTAPTLDHPRGELGEESAIVAMNQIHDSRVLTFAWNSAHPYPNYEVQLLKLNNEDVALQADEEQIRATVDWNRALKVETQSSAQEVTLTVAEGTGFYVWRVRPIGNYYTGGIANSQNYGSWSVAPAQGASLLLSKNNLAETEIFFLQDPDDQVNWIYNRIFSERDINNGVRVSEGMNYADGLMNPRQTQAAYQYTDESGTVQTENLTSQVILDYSGRASMSTMAVPTGEELDGYQLGFVKNEEGNLYTAADMDTDEKLFDPSKVLSTGSAYSYFSSENTDQTIPDAEGYVFSRTLFKQDGTGRVAEVSGVGKTHALGLQSDGRGRTTRTLYASATDAELIRVFGDEAPVGSSVIKVITIDPNNIGSIAYTSQEGHTIATALIGGIGETNLEELPSSETAVPLGNSTSRNTFQNNTFSSSRRFALPLDDEIEISYTFACDQIDWGCIEGGDCQYSVQLYLSDLDKGHVFQSTVFNIDESAGCQNGKLTIDLSALVWEYISPRPEDAQEGDDTEVETSPAAVEVPQVVDGKTVLTAGTYMVTKVVRSGIDPEEFIAQNVSGYSDELAPILDAIMREIEGVETQEALEDFEKWLIALVNDIRTQHEALGGDYKEDDYQLAFNGVRSEYGIADECMFNPLVVFEYVVDNPASELPGRFYFKRLGQGESPCCDDGVVEIPRSFKCEDCDALEERRGALNPKSNPADKELVYFYYQYLHDAVMEAKPEVIVYESQEDGDDNNIDEAQTKSNVNLEIRAN